MKSIKITRSSQVLVTPAEPTPAVNLPLSTIDKFQDLGDPIVMLHVYREGGAEAAGTIRDALAKALVHYYPIAGRFVDGPEGGGVIEINCNGKGAWFAEAKADCALDDVRHLENPCPMPLEELFPLGWDVHPPLYLQVTQFSCGGFIVGVKISHAIVDGIGCGQFFNTVAELARGFDRPTAKPVWLRDVLPKLPKLPQTPSSTTIAPPPPSFHYLDVHISLDYINRVKKDYYEKTGERCSTFDVSTALLWQCRTRAITSDSSAVDVDSDLYFTANVRPHFSDALPSSGGYYGNCTFRVHAKASTQLLIKAPIFDAVKLVREAKAKIPEVVQRWRSGKLEKNPYISNQKYETLFEVTDWSRIGIKEIDYGWGTAAWIAITSSYPLPVCYFGLPSTQENSHRAMAKCVKEEHVSAFQWELKKATTLDMTDEFFRNCRETKFDELTT